MPNNEIWNISDNIYVPIHVQLHALPQFRNFSAMHLSFKMCLPLIKMLWWKKQSKSNSSVMRVSYGPRNSLPYFSLWQEGRLGLCWPSKKWNRGIMELANFRFQVSNGCNKNSSQGLYYQCFKVRLWMLKSIPRLESHLLRSK